MSTFVLGYTAKYQREKYYLRKIFRKKVDNVLVKSWVAGWFDVVRIKYSWVSDNYGEQVHVLCFARYNKPKQ